MICEKIPEDGPEYGTKYKKLYTEIKAKLKVNYEKFVKELDEPPIANINSPGAGYWFPSSICW